MIYILLILFILTQVADVLLTNKCLEDGHREANPIVAKWMSLVGIKWWPLIKIPIITIAAYAAYVGDWLLIVVGVGFYIPILINNYKVWRK